MRPSIDCRLCGKTIEGDDEDSIAGVLDHMEEEHERELEKLILEETMTREDVDELHAQMIDQLREGRQKIIDDVEALEQRVDELEDSADV